MLMIGRSLYLEQNNISKANHRINEVTEYLDRAIISYHDGITIERQDRFLTGIERDIVQDRKMRY